MECLYVALGYVLPCKVFKNSSSGRELQGWPKVSPPTVQGSPSVSCPTWIRQDALHLPENKVWICLGAATAQECNESLLERGGIQLFPFGWRENLVNPAQSHRLSWKGKKNQSGCFMVKGNKSFIYGMVQHLLLLFLYIAWIYRHLPTYLSLESIKWRRGKAPSKDTMRRKGHSLGLGGVLGLIL